MTSRKRKSTYFESDEEFEMLLNSEKFEKNVVLRTNSHTLSNS